MITANTYAWTASTIDYMAITLQHTDGSSWAWGYNDTQISVKFTNGGTASGDDGGGDVEVPYNNLFKSTDADFVDGQILRSSVEQKLEQALYQVIFKQKLVAQFMFAVQVEQTTMTNQHQLFAYTIVARHSWQDSIHHR